MKMTSNRPRPALQIRALVLKCFRSTCWSLSDVLESGSSGIVLTGDCKTQSRTSQLPGPVTKFPAKAQRRKESQIVAVFSLRLCAFAREIFCRVSASDHLLCSETVDAQKRPSHDLVPNPGEVRIEAESSTPASWSFRNAYAGALGMAERIEDFRSHGRFRSGCEVKKIATGEFRSELDATKISYRVKLSKPASAIVPHVSWLVGDHGFLMFADLVPQDHQRVSFDLSLPPGWTWESSVSRMRTAIPGVGAAKGGIFHWSVRSRKRSSTLTG